MAKSVLILPKMLDQSLPENNISKVEQDRLKKLRDYEILDTPPETAFDTIAILAAEIFDSPNAYVTFVDEERVFFKANMGDDRKSYEIKRNESFCSLSILENEVTFFEDVSLIPNLKSTINITDSNVKFYAGAPLITLEGFKLGTVCVTDIVTRKPTPRQLNMLSMLATIVMEKLELRIAARKTLRAHDDRLHMLVHDLKNPMTTISLQSELIGRIPGVDTKITMIAGKINQQSHNIVNNLNNILSAARGEHGSVKLQKTKVDLKAILDKVQQNFGLVLENKNQSLIAKINDSIEIFGDKEKLQDVFENLVSNAIKYSEPGKEIKITTEIGENTVTVAVKDNGLGLLPEDIKLLFVKFARLSSVPTSHERSNGLGLSIVKMLVDLHKGKVWAESEGKNKGTTFFVELPIK